MITTKQARKENTIADYISEDGEHVEIVLGIIPISADRRNENSKNEIQPTFRQGKFNCFVLDIYSDGINYPYLNLRKEWYEPIRFRIEELAEQRANADEVIEDVEVMTTTLEYDNCITK